MTTSEKSVPVSSSQPLTNEAIVDQRIRSKNQCDTQLHAVCDEFERDQRAINIIFNLIKDDDQAGRRAEPFLRNAERQLDLMDRLVATTPAALFARVRALAVYSLVLGEGTLCNCDPIMARLLRGILRDAIQMANLQITDASPIAALSTATVPAGNETALSHPTPLHGPAAQPPLPVIHTASAA